MAISAGDAGCTTGLSGAIWAAWSADGAAGLASSGSGIAAAKAMIYRWAVAIANAHNSDGVSSTVSVQDEGIAKGAAGTFNFVGAGVTAAVSGGVATVTIPGGGGSAVTFVDGETPSGAVNGSNQTFTLAATPTAGSVHLYLNGVRLRAGTDFTISGATITMVAAPQTGDWLHADYRT